MNLKKRLEYHYRAFDRSKISPDPLEFLHRYNHPKDIEVIGFIASIFSYGNVSQIINTLNKITKAVGSSPYDFIVNFDIKKDSRRFENLKHRFYTSHNIIQLLDTLKNAYHQFCNLNNLFLFSFNSNDCNVKNGITAFSKFFIENCEVKYGCLNRGFIFMFPFPEKGSACKRMNLFLRWMIRKDDLDFGIWKGISTDKLIIPVDTHIAKICKELKLTKRKNVSWKMAEEITGNLKKYDSVDPVKYDFAICHIGMRKLEF